MNSNPTPLREDEGDRDVHATDAANGGGEADSGDGEMHADGTEDEAEPGRGARAISVLGDSISTFRGCNPQGYDVFYEDERLERTGVLREEQTWWQQAIEALGGRLLKNASFSGSLVEGGHFPAGDSDRRIEALAGEGGKIPDAVLVFMGINDYGWGGARAAADGRGSAVPPELAATAPDAPREPGLADAEALARFSQAYASMLSRIRARYPHTEVWCITLIPGRVAGAPRAQFAWDFRGAPFVRYNDAIRAAARETGCRVADAAACGMDYESLEGTHPTARGMRQIAAMVVYAAQNEGSVDASRFAESVAPSVWDDIPVWKSEPLCPNTPCATCAHATTTGRQWNLTCPLRG